MEHMPSPPVTIGFWPRIGAFVVDSACLTLIFMPLGYVVYRLALWLEGGGGILGLIVNWILPFMLVFWFWRRWLATPGKMLIPAEIVDSQTLKPPSNRQLLVRYLGYFVSLLPLGLGMIWVLIDPRDQAWHDKLAGTLVVRSEKIFFSPLTGKIIHIFSAMLAVFLVVSVGVAGVWAFRNGPSIWGGLGTLRAAVESGTLQGVMGTTDSCWDSAWTQSIQCSGPLCSLEGSFFLRGCLETSRPTPDTCQRVLTHNQWSVASWQLRCEELKQPGTGCVLLMGILAWHCLGNSKSEDLNPR